MSTSTFSIYWEVTNSGKYTGTPVTLHTKSALDDHGALLDLKRLPEEDNVSYYKRLQSVIPLRAGSHQEGLVHGITRELGLEEKIGIRISPISSSGKWVAPAPHMEITASTLTLYSAYYEEDDDSNEVDTEVDLFDHGDGYLMGDVVSEINGSQYFVAELGSYMDGTEKSSGLLPGSSMEVVLQEWVHPNTHFFLENDDIIPGSLFFTEREVFSIELSSALATPLDGGLTFTWAVSTPVVESGQYFVDYKTGKVTCYDTPSGAGTCRYVYRSFPWLVRWSPIIVYSLRDDSYREKIFESETMTDNSTRRGLANSEGVEIYTQVFEKSPCLWGE
jgi:hypothetical protein